MSSTNNGRQTAPVSDEWRESGDGRLAARYQLQLKMESLDRTSAQVRHASHAQALGHLRQPGSAGGEESAEQLTRAEFFESELPALGVAPQPLEDPGQVRRNRSLSFTEEPSGVINQKEIASQREPDEHPRTH